MKVRKNAKIRNRYNQVPPMIKLSLIHSMDPPELIVRNFTENSIGLIRVRIFIFQAAVP